MAKMSQQEIEAHLAEPRVAHLVTVRPDGRPHVAPVWFEWHNDRALVMTGSASVKVGNIRNNLAAALCIATDQRPYQYVTLEGEAEVTTRNLADAVKRICIRYDGPERGPTFAEELLADEHLVLINIRVTRVVSWKDTD